MLKFKITLLNSVGEEVIITTSTNDNIEQIYADGKLDEWIDLNYPKVIWDKIKCIEKVSTNFYQSIKSRMQKYARKGGEMKSDLGIEAYEPLSINNIQTNFIHK